MLIAMLVVLLIVVIGLWIVTILPLPSARYPLRSLLYVVVAAIFILYLLRFV